MNRFTAVVLCCWWGLFGVSVGHAAAPEWTSFSRLSAADWQKAFVFDSFHRGRDGRISASIGKKWGVISPDGNWLLPPRFDHALEFAEGLAVVRENGAYGYIDRSGKMVIPARFTWAGNFSGGMAAVTLDRVNGTVDRQGRFLAGREALGSPGRPGEYRRAADGHVVHRWADEDGKTRTELLDPQGRTVNVPAREGELANYTGEGTVTWSAGKKAYLLIDLKSGKELLRGYDVQPFKDGVAVVEREGRLGLFGRNGEWIVKPRYEQLYRISDRFFAARQKGRLGWIDHRGKEVVPPRFWQLGMFNNGLVMASDGCRQGLVNEQGEWVVKPEFDTIYSGPDGSLYAVVKLGQHGVIDSAGKWLTPMAVAGLEVWRQRQPVGGWGFIDSGGRQVIPPVFAAASDFDGDSAMLSLGDGKNGLVSRAGQWLVPPVFYHVEPFQGEVAETVVDQYGSGEAWVDRACRRVESPAGDAGELRVEQKPGMDWQKQAQNGLVGFADPRGAWMIPPRFEDAGQFAEGLAPVRVKGHWGYIDRRGELAIPARFAEAWEFSEGMAAVRIGEAWNFVDADGRVLWSGNDTPASPEGKKTHGKKARPTPDRRSWDGFEEVRDFHEGRAAVKRQEQWGYLDRHGAWAVAPAYSEAHDYSGGLARVRVANGTDGGRADPARPEKPGILTGVQLIDGGMALLQWGPYFAMMNRRGEVLVPEWPAGGGGK